ncbi:phytanoyl-CoA dioxygenase PhyH (macronuclear) [Tetrahymena thermophila SB210]|uniref:Phytanoyl-CoA dioxygenase PhyH n=1 Tax=Tetrahymena thermophila (strain SB210) TaxID=312017 RepID=Q22CQ5_TETTS|nr:phytanoyl-CoA dioxygenase PhyH [Tetrahymena thermophila SB210]EAR83060.2 phytanoyl-CoA dioxygenase PhyH [Tetrahymena thermophila SB210]|eukprot:XP_001030723.2 phytanoyl-CoA dioxygenase PhyH [Tetrahymena thermophila SB210]
MLKIAKSFRLASFSLFGKQKMFIATSSFDKVFTERHVKEYFENGATLVENVLTEQEVDQMIAETERLVKQNDIFKKIVYFKSGEDSRGLDFIETGDKIHFFFEENVFDKNGNLTVPKEHALNKIGHAMHDLDPFYQKFSYQPLYKYILQQIKYQAPSLVQSMYIYKNPKVGAQVCPHTDNTYLITEPKLSCVGFWFALHDATKENGCMWGVSGSQKESTKRFMYRNAAGDDVLYEGEEKKYELEKAVPLEVKRGSMLVFNGDYVHYSEHNKSKYPRHALTLHFVETANNIKWHSRNWLQRNPNLPFLDYNKQVEQLNGKI